MPVRTERYMLEAFLDGDAYSAIADKRRFSTVDNQINRITETIGDGRINGWEIEELAFPNILVTKGSGLIDKFYVNTFGDKIVELSENSTFYLYAQRKIGVIGSQGPKSDVVSIGYTDTGPPASPLNFVSVISGESSLPYYYDINLTWNSNIEPDFDHYELERKTNGDYSLVVSTSTDSYVDIVDEDTIYTYRLYSVDKSGNKSTPTTSVINVPLSTINPQNPINVLMPHSEGAINILWNKPPTTPVSKIDYWLVSCVELNPNGTERSYTQENHIVNKNLLYDRIDDLTVGQPYKVTIKTVDVKGRMSTGFSQNVIPQPTPAPRDPQGIAYTTVESGSGVEVQLSWTDGDTPYDSAVSYRYKIYTKIDGQNESVGIDVPIGFTEEQISLYTFNLVDYFSIPENILVTFRITSLDESGFESFGNYIRFVTPVFTLPLRLRNVNSEFSSDTGNITITWDNQQDTDDVIIRIVDEDLESEYTVQSEIINENIGRTEIYVFTAELNHKYTIYLTPFNADDIEGPTTSTVELTSIPGGLPEPEPPEIINAKSNDRQISLTWSQSTSLFTKEYKIYRKSDDITFEFNDWSLVDTLPYTRLSFIDFGLNNDTLYSYYITAVDIYNRESLHLADNAVNLNFVQSTPRREGILTEPSNVQIVLVGNNITLTWDSLSEEFNGFTIWRSIGNLYSWSAVATVDSGTFLYTDIELPLIDGTVFYYVVDKTVDDAQIVSQVSSTPPENSIFLAQVTTSNSESSQITIDVSNRRDIDDMVDPLTEFTNQFILPHRHREILFDDPERIDLNPELIVTDWKTVDGRIFSTSERDINGSSFLLKIDGKLPRIFYTVDPLRRQIIFTENIVEFDEETGIVTGDIPEIELRVLGVEEVQNVLDEFRFNNIHARQIEFGTLNKEQFPELNHEGRLRETLFPERFTLERYNNNTFIVPQGNTDETKNFGTGTTFYCVIESDGKVSEIVDWDTQSDGAIVGFRKPSFSETTVLNLKQHPSTEVMLSGGDNAVYYRFIQDGDFVTGSNGTIYFMTLSPQINSEVGSPGASTLISFAIDELNQKFYAVEDTGSSFNLIEIDPATCESLSSVDISAGIDPVIEFVNGVCYLIDNSGNTINTLNISNGTVTNIDSVSDDINAMAYVSSESKMYVIRDDGATDILTTISLVDGSFDPSPGDSLGSVGSSLWYRKNSGSSVLLESDKLYYAINNGFSSDIYRIDDRSAGSVSDTNITTWNNSSFSTGITFNENWWKPSPNKIRMGDFIGTKCDTYLRFPINIPINSTVSDAEIVFTAHDEESSSGSNVVLEVSIIDPGEYSDGTNLSFSSITDLDVIGSIIWRPASWVSGQTDTLDVTSLVQAFIDNENYFVGRHIIFLIKTHDLTSSGHHRTAFSFANDSNDPVLNTSYVIDVARVNSDPGGFQSEKSYEFRFEFEDNDPKRWVRISTEDTPVKPNPVIDLSKRIRFRYLLQSGSLYLTLGIREISNSNLSIGSNGGTSGTIEWIGADSILLDDDGNSTPIGILINSSSEWQEIDIDLQKSSIKPFDGNGLLNKVGFGVLEHLAFTINPDDDNPTGPFVLYIDKMEQVDDLLVAGTSRGILISSDFGITWDLSRLTDTPVHKFYKAQNNKFLWAISSTEVLLSIDPAFWFATQGTAGINNIRDIIDDENGNMFISSDKGVYWLEISIIKSFSMFRQTQPINAFTTDTYAVFHNPVSSGIDEIWASTEIGIYKTSNFGLTWEDTGLGTSGLVAFQIINIGSLVSPNLIAITRKHVLRKLHTDSFFQVIADFEDQHGIFDIWRVEYFSGKLYVSTSHGIYSNDLDDLFTPGISTITFSRTLENLDFNGFIQVAFGMNTINIGNENKLFIGLENKLVQVSEDLKTSIKKEYRNVSLPSFFIDDEEVTIGYTYNVFNNVLIFREPVLVNKIVSAAHIPRRSFFAKNGGWSQNNPGTDTFIYKNGIPTWLDFNYDQNNILGELQILDGKLRTIESLSSFNSLLPDAQNYLSSVIEDISTIRTGGENNTPLINNDTIIQFMNNYTRFLSLITETYAARNDLYPIPILRSGIARSSRQPNSRAEMLENKEDFTSEESSGISIDITTGEVDFTTAFTNATDPIERSKYTFKKFDHMEISIYNSNVLNTGEFTHKYLEDSMEEINTGLSSNLAKSNYANLIKSGIFLEQQHNYLFNRYNASNIQAKFYAAHNNDWYDILNSTLDYDLILKTETIPNSRFVNVAILLDDSEYIDSRVWLGTDNNITEFTFDDDNEVQLSNIIKPYEENLFIWDIYSYNDLVYVVGTENSGKSHILVTSDLGVTWEEEGLINLPDAIYNFSIINGIKVCSTENGMFYNDNEFGTWFPCAVVPSSNLPENSTSLASFVKPIFNTTQSRFIVVESEKWFYTTGSGIEFFALAGQLSLNNLSVINKIIRHKSLTWIATDKGIYNDGNSILSDSVQWGLQTTIENSLNESVSVKVNDLVSGSDALYAAAENGKVYRYLDEDSEMTWTKYFIPDFGSVHKILVSESRQRLIVISYNKIRSINISEDSGVFNA